jgi:hypothetical protein
MSEPEVERRFDSMTKDEIQLRFLLYEAIQELCYIQEYESGWPRELIATSKGKEMIERGMELLGVRDLSASCLSEFLEAAKIEVGEEAHG